MARYKEQDQDDSDSDVVEAEIDELLDIGDDEFENEDDEE